MYHFSRPFKIEKTQTYLSEAVREVILVVTDGRVHAVHHQTHLSPLPCPDEGQEITHTVNSPNKDRN